MATRNVVLMSVASLAFAGVLAAATPIFAQDLETQRTDQLNAAQATPLPPAPSPADQAAYDAALAQHDQAQAQYNSQLQDYQAKQRAYEDEQRNYRTRTEAYGAQSDIYQDQAAGYDADRRAFDDTVVVERPAPPADTVVIERPPARVLTYPDGHDRLWDLGALEDPEREIGGVAVQARDGEVVGHFERITHQDEGIPKAVITLMNNKTVVVDQDHFRYDPDAIVVVADMSYDELNSMPARF
jgi:hypothetical protein